MGAPLKFVKTSTRIRVSEAYRKWRRTQMLKPPRQRRSEEG